MDATNTARVAAQGGPARRTQAGQRLSRFVFTLNNYTEQEYANLTEDFALQTKWLMIAKETAPDTGTPHLQGACVLGAQWTFSRLKGVSGLARAHIEVMRGQPCDSDVYLSKEDLEPFVHGNMPNPGKRNDLRLATDKILAGTSIRELAKDPEMATVVVKFNKGLTVLSALTKPPRKEAPIVLWLHGSTGTGKTRCALKSGRAMARAYGRPADDIWINDGGLRWFDQYDGQTVAILDDFRAKHVTSFAFFLRLLDRYTLRVEFKGGFVAWTPKVIIITCPYSPDLAFATRGVHVPEDMAQLHRRITQVVEFKHEFSKENRQEFVEDVLSLLPRELQQREETQVEETDEDMLDPCFLF